MYILKSYLIQVNSGCGHGSTDWGTIGVGSVLKYPKRRMFFIQIDYDKIQKK